MAQRGRKSAAALEVVEEVGVTASPRPSAPKELTTEQATVWKIIVGAMPADWFGPETRPLLIQYCRHVVTARRVGQLIEACEAQDAVNFDIEDYDKLLKMQEREGRAMSSLGTRMRITQQALLDPDRKKPKSPNKPWG